MISAYFDVKPRKAASVPVRQAAPEVFKPSPQPSSPQAITPGLVMHAQFKPIAGSFGRSEVDEDDTMGETIGEFYDAGEEDDRDPDDENDEDGFPETEELESLTDATAATLDEIDLEADEPGDPAIDAHFFGSIARRKRADKEDVMSIVFSGPMLCCEEEDFD